LAADDRNSMEASGSQWNGRAEGICDVPVFRVRLRVR
jgi:hypothetical protein